MEWDQTEPEHTIYLSQWQEAHDRLGQLDPSVQDLFVRLLALIESGWINCVRQLELFHERNTYLQALDQGIADVLSFIDADVVDVYRVIAAEAANLVPGWDGWFEAADPGDLEGDASMFVRYLGVLRLAVQSLPPAADGLKGTCADMRAWYREVSALLKQIDDEVVRPSLPPDPWE